LVDLLYFFGFHWTTNNGPIQWAGWIGSAIHAVIARRLRLPGLCRRGCNPDRLRETWRGRADLRTAERILGVIQGPVLRVRYGGENWQDDGGNCEAAHSGCSSNVDDTIARIGKANGRSEAGHGDMPMSGPGDEVAGGVQGVIVRGTVHVLRVA